MILQTPKSLPESPFGCLWLWFTLRSLLGLAAWLLPKSSATGPILMIALGLPLIFPPCATQLLLWHAVATHAPDHQRNLVPPERHHGNCDGSYRNCLVGHRRSALGAMTFEGSR